MFAPWRNTPSPLCRGKRGAVSIYIYITLFALHFKSHVVVVAFFHALAKTLSHKHITGKSTQVPQFLLDANPTSRIVVTQPRRLSAIAIAERVAEEQCQADGVGGLIGYQVRLESAVSNRTQLLFLTPGVLLRQMQSSPQLCEYTHIVIDEIHERDKYQEFLLIVLRDLLPRRPDLRLVLMSATLQTVTLVEYFSSRTSPSQHQRQSPPAIVEMEGRMFPVQQYFLEHVLEMTGYIDAATGYDGGARLEQDLAKVMGRDTEEWQKDDHARPQPSNQGTATAAVTMIANVTMQCVLCGKRGFVDAVELGAHIALCGGFSDSDNDDNDDDDAAGHSDYNNGTITSEQEQAVIIEESDHGALSQFDDYDVNGALGFEDYAVHAKKQEQNLETGTNSVSGTSEGPMEDTRDKKWDGISHFDFLAPGADDEPSDAKDALLNQYQTMHDDETIDNILLLEVIQYIVKCSYGDGGILVFLPGWQEISEVSNMLEGTHPFRDRSKFLVLPLHSGIPSRDQRRVLQRPPKGVRKIVLSTNIAETRYVTVG